MRKAEPVRASQKHGSWSPKYARQSQHRCHLEAPVACWLRPNAPEIRTAWRSQTHPRTARQAHCEEARAYEGAREFLELALNVDPRARFEADAALAHPWLSRVPPR